MSLGLAPAVQLRGISKRFGDYLALAPCDLTVPQGEFLSIIGESGCGKTTLLRLVAGLEKPSTGTVALNGKPIDSPADCVGFVFQKPVLLEWRTALQNVLLPAQVSGQPVGPELQRRAEDLLDQIGVGEASHKLPRALSGGMQSRVALARALLLVPSLLLLDEPFAALDALTRERMAITLLAQWAANSLTALFVTHDIGEAVFLSDRVILMASHPGRLHQSYTVPLPRPRAPAMRYEAAYIELCRTIRLDMAEVERDHREGASIKLPKVHR